MNRWDRVVPCGPSCVGVYEDIVIAAVLVPMFIGTIRNKNLASVAKANSKSTLAQEQLTGVFIILTFLFTNLVHKL